ncbi:MAG: hypothetical protein JO360_18230 [Acidobacteria bacterium]|nr:hypothetical protein [Acidobacteriota bacterium]
MRNTIKAVLLTLALAIPVWAGDMGNPAPPPPQQQGRQATESPEPAKTGDIGQPITATDIGLSVLQSLLALF